MKRYLIFAFLVLCVKSFSQIPLWQLEYAPDSLHIVGAYPDGEPVWKNIAQLIKSDSIYISNDTIFLRDGSGFVVLPENECGVIITMKSNSDELPEEANCGDFAVYPNGNIYYFDGFGWGLFYKKQRFYYSPEHPDKDEIDAKYGDIYVDLGNYVNWYYDGSYWQIFDYDNNPFNEGNLSFWQAGADSIHFQSGTNMFQIFKFRGNNGITLNYDDVNSIFDIGYSGSVSIDSTIVTGGYGIDVTESPDNTFTVSADTSQLATQYDLSLKQDVLVSGTNIKTVNGNSLLGSGNVSVGTVKGAGSVNKLAYWAAADSLTYNNNLGYTSGGNFHVGTTSGAYRVTSVAEDYAAYIGNAGNTRGLWVVPESSNPWTVEVLGNTKLSGTILNSSGSAGSSGQVLTSQGSGNWIWTTPTAGTVTSVGLSTGTTGTDVNVSGSPVTGAGTITLNIPTASATNRGALSSADWTTFNNKIGSLNGLTGATQTLATSNSNIGFTITSSGSTHTFNLPYTENTAALRLGQNAKLGSSNSVAIGQNAGNTDMSNAIAIGRNALQNSTATNNVAVGLEALKNLTSGIDNVSLGSYAGASLTTGQNNFALGTQALTSATTATDNVAIGRAAGRITNGTGNIFIGSNSGFNNTAQFSINIGRSSGFAATGSYNMFIGDNSGYNNTGSNNTFIGENSGDNSGSMSNSVLIGRYAGRYVTRSQSLIINNDFHAAGLITGQFDNKRVGINQDVTDITRTLDINGEVRIRDLVTTTPTGIVGRDTDGVLSGVTIGSGLTLSSGTLTANDNSNTNELQSYSHSGTTSYTNTLSGGGGSFTLQAGTGISLSHSAGTTTISAVGGGVTGSGTATQVAYWSGTSSLTGNSNLYWNNGQVRLGIGTATPLTTLEVLSPSGAYTSSKGILSTHGSSSYGLLMNHAGASTYQLSFGTAASTYNYLGNSGLYFDGANDRIGIKAITPTRDMDVNGEVRIRDLNTGTTSTSLVGADATGVINSIAISTGLSMSSNTLTSSAVDIQAFTTAGTFTWTKPAGAKTVYVLLIGGGGGGAGGSKQATGVAANGGGGGQGGGVSEYTFRADDFGGTETVVVGAGGTGGAGATTNGTLGNNGTDGGHSRFGLNIYANGGMQGINQGTPAPLNSGMGTREDGALGAYWNSASTSVSGANSKYAPTGGGAGGGITSSNTLVTPPANGSLLLMAGGSGGSIRPGLGGLGGVASTSGNGSNGSAATSWYGGGGGGGGAARNSVGNGGAGGAGRQGAVMVITYR